MRQLAAQRMAGMVAPQIDRLRTGDALPSAEVVVKEQPGAQQQPGAAARHLRQHEALRPDDMAGVGQQHLALLQRLAHEPEFVVLEIAQAAVDELGARRRRGAAQIALLQQEHGKPAARGIGRNAGAVDAAAGNDEVVGHGGQPSMRTITARYPPGAAPAL